MQNFRNEALELLVKALVKTDNEEDCYALLDDLCTVKELQDLSQRFETAVLLSEGMNYLQIADKAGTSSATISRVNRCLQYGNGGYTKAINKIKDNSNDNK